MRKLLIALMMLVMLTPSLACAMPVCAGDAAVKTVANPCPEHTANHSSNQKSEAGQKLKLLKDCMGVDLQVADSISIDKPDVHSPVFAFVWGSSLPVIEPDAKADAIRGPPPDWPSAHSIKPSLILSTQRFRI